MIWIVSLLAVTGAGVYIFYDLFQQELHRSQTDHFALRQILILSYTVFATLLISRLSFRYFQNSNVDRLSTLLNKKTENIIKRNAQLERVARKAERASQSKSEFLANMSHEIRTPMNGILGAATLAREAESESERDEFLDLIQSSSEALLAVINDVLDFSKIEAGKLELNKKPFAFAHIISSLDAMFSLSLREKKLALEWEIDPLAERAFYGDPDRIKQIFINLIGNAIKFTNSGGNILCKISAGNQLPAQQTILLSVSDTGKGIPDHMQDAIFESFTQVHHAPVADSTGTGLGLAIVSKLVRLMGGAVWFESTVGVGTTFYFTLVLHPALEKVELESVAGDVELHAHGKKKARILLAEDNIVNQRITARILEKSGYQVTIASNGREAVTLFSKDPHDLVLMDCEMPELDGYEATLQIRNLPGGIIPIIALTAHVMKGDEERCLNSGMNGYLPKPINRENLLRKISRSLDTRKDANV